MTAFRCLAFWLGLTLFAGPFLSVEAQDEKKKGKFLGKIGEARPLLPSEGAEKLKLSDEQKDKVVTLQKEFDEKLKEATGKVRDDLKKAIADKDKDAIKTAFGQMREAREKEDKLRTDYESKLAALLTDEQKTKFEDVKKDQPKEGSFGRGGARRGPGQVLPSEIQQELKLTDEQKEKVAKLQKELEAKIMEVLTEEQKKKLDELKKQGASGRPSGKKKADNE